MGESDNHLRIRTDRLEIDLRGDPDAILDAYDQLRDSLGELYDAADREAMVSANHQAVETADSSEDSGDPDDTLTPPGVQPGPENAQIVRLVLRRDRYEKVVLFERTQVDESFLGEALAADRVGRIYCGASVENRLRSSVELGKTMWRKLTPDGRDALEEASSNSAPEQNGD